MRALFDTNVVLDLLLNRTPFSETAAKLFARVEKGELVGYLGATTVTAIHYLSTKVLGAHAAQKEIVKLLGLFEIAPVNRAVLESALQMNYEHFEDAVIHEAARHGGAELIVTRNGQDFKRAQLAIYAPLELEAILSQA